MLGAAQHGGHADATAHQQVAALRLHLEAVAQGAQHIQLFAHLALSQPAGALTPGLKDHADKVSFHRPAANGDGAAQQQTFPTAHVDKLSGAGDLGGHAVALEGHGHTTGGEVYGLHDGAALFYSHISLPLLA